VLFQLLVAGNGLIGALDQSRLNLPILGLLALRGVLCVLVAALAWLIPTAAAIAFAASFRMRSALMCGVSSAIALTAAFVWITGSADSHVLTRIAMIAVGCVLLVGAVLSFRLLQLPPLVLANAAAFGLLLVPACVAIASAPKQPERSAAGVEYQIDE
jgi:hypothetical protein